VSAKPKTTTGHKEKDLATKKDLRQVQSEVLLLFLLVVIHIFVILENVETLAAGVGRNSFVSDGTFTWL